MPTYNFKAMKVVPTAKDFIDIVLSKTQRQTPTVNHAGWHITRIRSFYMRKVKYTQQTWNERLGQILEDFPKVDEIHPFYADLMNVLYDKDHYKLALGQVNMARTLIDKLANDYVRMLKYADSQYRAKTLKRAALGRMCTIIKRQGPSLAYLEQVRQHMSRLPSIDPNTRTLLVCGYPNVGKSSFINKVTRADVEVQPYAFTTKSLYVGHLDYKYLRWQVVDSPGILDRPLEERNTIEMQSITAMAHLRAAVLYLVDVSEQCGYSVAQQAALFHSIKPLFANKPVLVVVNKVDVTPYEALGEEARGLVQEMVEEAAKISNGGIPPHAGQGETCFAAMSTLTDDASVQAVKNLACERLLAARVQLKLRSKKVADVANRVHVAVPKATGGAARPPVIPAGVEAARRAREEGLRRKTERDLQEENGGAGVYNADLRKMYDLPADWRYDVMPETLDGHNVADFVDPDIDAKLEALEREEDEMLREWQEQSMAEAIPAEEDLTPEDRALLMRINDKKKKLKALSREKKVRASNNPVVPRTVASYAGDERLERAREELRGRGVDTTAAEARIRSQSRGRPLKRGLSESRASSRGGAEVDDDGDAEMGGEGRKRVRTHSKPSRSLSRGRSVSMAPVAPGSGLKDASQRNKSLKMGDVAQRHLSMDKHRARAGEADRRLFNKMPKHLFSGKRKQGKTDRR